MTIEELNMEIEQKQADLKKLTQDRKRILSEQFNPMIGKYYKNEHYADNYFYVEFIGKDIMLPHGFEIEYKSIRGGRIDIPGQWIEVTKEEFEKAFNAEVDRLRKDLKL